MTATSTALARYRANTKLVRTPGKWGFCLIWTGETVRGPYGRFRPVPGGQKELVHRWAYRTFIGPIPPGKEIDHFFCNNSLCVKPSHLRPATALENTRAAPRHNANKTCCKHGHRFTLRNIYWQTSVKRGKAYRCRRCRTCLGMDAASITLATLTTRRSSWQEESTGTARRE